MERFSIDESGYTGFDLLNADQRFQGASATSITDEMARLLIKEHFPALKAIEIKYRGVARRPSNRERLLSPAQAVDALIRRQWCLEAVAQYPDQTLRAGAKALGVDVANSENGLVIIIDHHRIKCITRPIEETLVGQTAGKNGHSRKRRRDGSARRANDALTWLLHGSANRDGSGPNGAGRCGAFSAAVLGRAAAVRRPRAEDDRAGSASRPTPSLRTSAWPRRG